MTYLSGFEGFPVEISPAFEGQRVRKEDMYVEFGGPNIPKKFELVRVKSMEEVEDGLVKIVGPDLAELKEGSSNPLGILIEVAGSRIDRDLEGVIERRIHMYTNYIEGIMHLNQRYDIWCRISKKSVKKGLTSLKWWGIGLIKLFKAEMPYIEKMQVTFITDPVEVERIFDEAMKIYNERDARARGLRDEEVDLFYGCVLCQSFAPTHVCVISPERVSLCGALTWFDARAAANIDPKGPNFPVPKGECLDPVRGEWSGVNEAVQKKSLGAIKRVYLHSAFQYPHTSCGCFECIMFYIPEVDGFGIVDRGFRGEAVNGLSFSTMASQTGGGMQSEGFLGVGIEYMRSRKFIQADGGWSRIVWMSSALRKRVEDAIPQELKDKIPTENEVKNVEELRKYLVEKRHPAAEKIVEVKPEVKPEAPPTPPTPQIPITIPQIPAITPQIPATMPTAAGGVKIVLQGARIKIGKLIVKKAESVK